MDRARRRRVRARAETARPAVRRQRGAGAAVQLAFRVPLDTLGREEASLRARGIEVVEPVTRNDGSGHTTLFLLDPERNVVELFAEHEASARSLAAEASQTAP